MPGLLSVLGMASPVETFAAPVTQQVIMAGLRGPAGPAGSGVRIMGSRAAVEFLPQNPSIGDAYLITQNLWVWEGLAWENTGPVVGPQGIQGIQGPQGIQGIQGPSGLSAYAVALAQGFVGTELEWLASLVGPVGPSVLIMGTLSSSVNLPIPGVATEAYLVNGHLWVWHTNKWNDAGSLQGPQGIQGIQGNPGISAYAVALAQGFVGSEAQWLASLEGPQGPVGAGIHILGSFATPGELPAGAALGDAYIVAEHLWAWDGIAWVDTGSIVGPAGPQGPSGADGIDGADGLSAYELALAGGFVGDMAAWLASLEGAPGATGPEGPQGVAGTQSLIIACSDETTALTAGAGKVTFRMPYACTLLAVYAEVVTAQVGGNILTVDINEAGTSVLSTKLTIDNGEEDSATATTPAVISDANLAARAKMTIDIDQVGDGTAKGLKVTLIVVPV